MSAISEMKIRLFHPAVFAESDIDAICRRLAKHLARVRFKKRGSPIHADLDAFEAHMDAVEADMDNFEAYMDAFDAHPDEFDEYMNELEGDVDDFGLRHLDRQRIHVRAKQIVALRDSANQVSLGHLSDMNADRDRAALLELAGMVPVKAIADEATADEVAASLHAEFPWMAAATTAVWYALRRCARRGCPISVGPLLLHGPPGIGKTAWACGLSRALDLPHCVIDASQGLSSMALAGTERGWRDQQPGRPLQTVMSSRVANPVIVVDEVDKGDTKRYTSGGSLAFQPALLGLLEPGSAQRWQCPYYRIGVDMSHLSWVLTANEIGLVSEPVRSRCEIVQLGDLSVEELSGFAERQATRLGLPAAASGAVQRAIERAAITGCLQRCQVQFKTDPGIAFNFDPP
ncbi:MAG: AAA family ATPase, partial [Boseongicola sp. SB0662_bin_57]|nr:AAA family ATPase [Boseongicola sp. SB0662_bin_57]